METVIVVVVESEVTAQNAAHALALLADAGAIGLTAAAIVIKSPDGAVRLRKSRPTLPARGLAAGALGGLITALTRLPAMREFIAGVERTLEPGRSAVVALIDEEDTRPVDEQMATFGAPVLRRELTDVSNEHYDNEVVALERLFTGEPRV